MSLTKFEILSTVVVEGSLTKAAESLSMTQSAVSHAISSLELEWGFALLNRDRSGISLTNNGERVLKHIRDVLQYNESLKQEVASINGLEVGTVRIGSFTSVSALWLPEIIKEFEMQYPSIEIKIFEGNYDDIEQWILEGSIDFGFLTLPSSNTLETVPLKKDKVRCVLPINHHLCHNKTILFEEMKREPFIMPKWGNDNDVVPLLKKNKDAFQVKYEIVEEATIIAMVRHGLGISILPEMLLVDVQDDIAIVDLEGEHYRTIGIATQSIKKISPASKRFITLVKSWLQANNLLDY
ncbi:LysR family transcriptional regulator [Bacillus massiliigorillae]|uniref:LysR family transcriptional regulator n=1 Tax=Bacillus massiliigorillae TaxID=1243664 RepID=UPI0003A29F6F|nr:LysR family transcriptional regulator [Bacillus massiliigorillae]